MKPKKKTKEDKRIEILEAQKAVMVNTFDGKESLYHLCEEIGIKERVEYFNMIEKLKPKKIRTLLEPTHVIRVVSDRGFVFNNGFEIKGVEAKVFNLYPDIKLKEIRKRTR